MKGIFSFLKSKYFFINIGLSALAVFVIFIMIIKFLSSYTNHGIFVQVPDFKGKSINELQAFVKDKNISFQIIDSIYDPKEKTGVVLKQDPEPLSKVKHNRTIYLYVTGNVAPKIIMPKLIDRSERQARFIINSYGLKVGHITTKNADCDGCVLSQTSNGKDINAGEFIKKGSVINLVIGIKNSYYTTSTSDSTNNIQNENLDND
ncbi:MAG: PASTA domain-containing protein [Bacteroidetes bacterium]|nr:PASTA domain-containing protein [Bacteroidota bacterium]